MLFSRTRPYILAVVLMIYGSGMAWSADTYQLDTAHTLVGFTVRHLVITKVRGKFQDYSATLMYDPNDLTQSSLQGTIKVASVDTDNEKRDNHLRSADFFDVARFPELTFASTGVEKTGDNSGIMRGNLTIHGVTKEVAIPFTITGPITHRGTPRIGFEASLEVERRDFDIVYDKTTDNGGLIVGNTVRIELVGEAVKQ